MLIFKNEKTKKILSGIFAILMVLSVAGCGSDKGKNDTSSTDSKSGGISANKIDTSNSKIANKDFEGKYFRMLFRWEPGDITTRTIEAFNRDHNANIEVVVDTSNTVYQCMALSIASGQPYDLVSVYDYYFPNMITQDLVVPLESYYTDVDLYDDSKPENGGLLKQFSEHYTLNNSVYAVGSTRSVYQLAMYYNKKLFKDSGLEDPWELYKAGKWNWAKFLEMGKSVTDASQKIAFTSFTDVHVWTSLCGLQVIKKNDDGSFRSAAKDADVIDALKEYQSMYLGANPICITGATFGSGTLYTSFAPITAYSNNIKTAMDSTAFDKDAANLGVVPCPIPDASITKAYPVHASAGYASCKGASDPSIAVCFALYESRTKDSDTGDDLQLDPEIYETILAEYAKSPSFTYDGFADTAGKSVGEYYRDSIGKAIAGGADVTQTLSNANSVIENMIVSSLKK